MKINLLAFSCAPISMALFCLTPAALAQNTQIEEMLVTASPHAKTADEIAGSLNVLSQEDLQREVGSTLGDSLKNQIGVHSSSFGPGVGVPVIRGQSGKRVEVLQNNAVVADVSDTSSDHAVASEVLLADRIEILRGPATLRYGAGAIGGVINVIDNRIHTEPFEGISAALETRYNQNNDEKVGVARIDAGAGQLGIHFDAVSRESGIVEIPGLAELDADDVNETTNGYVENSDSESNSYSLGLSWIVDNQVAGISVSRTENNYGIPGGGHGHGHEEEEHEEDEDEGEHEEESILTRIDMEQTLYQGKLLFKDLAGVMQDLDIDLSYTDYGHNELEIEDGSAEVGTLFDLSATELRTELTHEQMGNWIGAIGLQLSDKDFNAVGEEAFVPASTTERQAIFLIEETELGDGVLELGARLDNQNISSPEISDLNHTSFNFSANYLLPLGEGQRLGFVASRSERAPVAEELLSDGEHIATSTYEIGTASLDNESSHNLEITWTLESRTALSFVQGFSARASLFYSGFTGYIYEMDTELRFSHGLEEDGFSGFSSCSEDLADFENNQEEFDESLECFLYTQEDAAFSGIEAEVSLELTDNHSARIWTDYVRASFTDSGDVPRMPPARLGASWDYSVENWSGQLSLAHALDQNNPGEGQSETDGYTRLDAYVSWDAEPLTIFIKGTNLTDSDIRNSTSFLREISPEPGRAFTLGARYRF